LGESEVDEQHGGPGIPREPFADPIEKLLKNYPTSLAWEIKVKLHKARGRILERRRINDLRDKNGGVVNAFRQLVEAGEVLRRDISPAVLDASGSHLPFTLAWAKHNLAMLEAPRGNGGRPVEEHTVELRRDLDSFGLPKREIDDLVRELRNSLK
jgi:hypothetical protein